MNLKVLGFTIAVISVAVIIFVYPFAYENLTALTGIRFVAGFTFLIGVGMIAAHYEATRPKLRLIQGKHTN